MVKFQFFRTSDPLPNSLATLLPTEHAPNRSHAIHADILRFLGATELGPQPATEELPAIIEDLFKLHASEASRVGAAYSLGRFVREGTVSPVCIHHSNS